jgi:hypothetical protein
MIKHTIAALALMLSVTSATAFDRTALPTILAMIVYYDSYCDRLPDPAMKFVDILTIGMSQQDVRDGVHAVQAMEARANGRLCEILKPTVDSFRADIRR